MSEANKPLASRGGRCGYVLCGRAHHGGVVQHGSRGVVQLLALFRVPGGPVDRLASHRVEAAPAEQLHPQGVGTDVGAAAACGT